MEFVSTTAAHQTLVVDQWPLMRGAITNLLNKTGTTEVAGAADSAESALGMCRELRPDLVITDCDLLASGDGVRLGRRLKELARPPMVLLYASRNEPSIVVECLSGAADGFVHRSAEPELLLEAVGLLTLGRATWYVGNKERAPEGSAQDTPMPHMTSREQEILGLLLQRYSNDEIATELYLARQTVKNYVSTVLQKLEVPSRRELYRRTRARYISPASRRTRPL